MAGKSLAGAGLSSFGELKGAVMRCVRAAKNKQAVVKCVLFSPSRPGLRRMSDRKRASYGVTRRYRYSTAKYRASGRKKFRVGSSGRVTRAAGKKGRSLRAGLKRMRAQGVAGLGRRTTKASRSAAARKGWRRRKRGGRRR